MWEHLALVSPPVPYSDFCSVHPAPSCRAVESDWARRHPDSSERGCCRRWQRCLWVPLSRLSSSPRLCWCRRHWQPAAARKRWPPCPSPSDLRPPRGWLEAARERGGWTWWGWSAPPCGTADSWRGRGPRAGSSRWDPRKGWGWWRCWWTSGTPPWSRPACATPAAAARENRVMENHWIFSEGKERKGVHEKPQTGHDWFRHLQASLKGLPMGVFRTCNQNVSAMSSWSWPCTRPLTTKATSVSQRLDLCRTTPVGVKSCYALFSPVPTLQPPPPPATPATNHDRLVICGIYALSVCLSLSLSVCPSPPPPHLPGMQISRGRL